MVASLVNEIRNRESPIVRTATAEDAEQIWRIFHAVVSRGDTYAFAPDISREEALASWLDPDTRTFVAVSEGQIGGTYILKPNQPGLGSHVANAGFMVSPLAQGRGLGRAMAEHCLAEERRRGFRAMQFNFVISTNAPAISLWQSLGFDIVGTLPGAFRHRELGFVDVCIMFRSLIEGRESAAGEPSN